MSIQGITPSFLESRRLIRWPVLLLFFFFLLCIVIVHLASSLSSYKEERGERREAIPKKNWERPRFDPSTSSTSTIYDWRLRPLGHRRPTELQNESNVHITGKQQHGFKKGKSTLTLSLEIQSLIAWVVNENNYVLAGKPRFIYN